jgi:hypothetical protein
MSKNKIIIKLSSLKACDREVIVSLLADQDQLKGNLFFYICLSFIVYLSIVCFVFYTFFILVVDDANLLLYAKLSPPSSPPSELSNSPIANSLLELGTRLSLKAKYDDYEFLSGMRIYSII